VGGCASPRRARTRTRRGHDIWYNLMFYQILSLIGAVLILGAYLAFQRGWLGRADRSFHALNFLGGVVLCWVAIHDRRAGFILVEAAWALLSLPGTIRPPKDASPKA